MKSLFKLDAFILAIIIVLPGICISQQKLTDYYLPFSEDWQFGNFTANNWQKDSDNWAIDTQDGNEKPSAKFHRTAVLTNYTSSLLSNTIDAQNIKVGHVYLKFDLKLDDYNNNGTEYIKIKVSDSAGWHSIDSVSNTGSFDWETLTYDIKEYALGQVFQFKFEASGNNSMNILDWYIDNIEVYRECDAPEDLYAEYIWNSNDSWGFQANWKSPPSVDKRVNYIQYCKNTNSSAIGTNEFDYSVAIRWDSGDLNQYKNDTIEEISLYLYDTGVDYIVVKIWNGSNAVNEIYSDTLENLINESWNIIDINDTILIQKDTEYWFGYKIIGNDYLNYPVGFDSNPTVDGYGNKMKIEGEDWINYPNWGFGNWNIKVKLKGLPLLSPNSLIGFNIFMKNFSDSTYALVNFVDYEDSVKNYKYFVNYNNNTETDIECVKVNALWNEENDSCISEYANLIYDSNLNEACLFPIGIVNTISSYCSVYPNPTTSDLNINSENIINSILIYNLAGQLIINNYNINSNKTSINLSALKKGIYFIKIQTNKSTITRKFIKQ